MRRATDDHGGFAAIVLWIAGCALATIATGGAAVAQPAHPPHPAQKRSSQRAKLPPWVQSSRGILTYKRDIPGSDIIALRGEGTVDAPLIRVVSVLLDYARAPEWVDSLEEVRIVRMTGPLEFVEYDRVGTPPIIMKDRDFVCRAKLSLDLGKQTFMMTMEPTRDPAVPPDDRYVRGELRGFWKLQAIDGGRRTFVVAEMHGDPKGGVPKWLVNLFQSGWARSTLEDLRAQVAKRTSKSRRR
jgi:hypothetical protein